MYFFKGYTLSLLSFSTHGEFDVDFKQFISNSLTEETVIITDNFTLITDFSKYKKIIKIKDFQDILDAVSILNNKQIFLDVYINCLSNNMSLLERANEIKKFLGKLRSLLIENDLELITIYQSYKNRYNQHIYNQHSSEIYVSDLHINYNHENKTLNVVKDRINPSIREINLLTWKKEFRKQKIERLLEKK